MKAFARIVLAAICTIAQASSFAAPTSAPSAVTTTPPIGGYGYLTKTSDDIGVYRLDYKNMSSPTERFKHPIYWVRVSRFAQVGNAKSAYPVEYLLFKVDCSSQTYVVTARYDVDRDGKDIGPRLHIFTNPVHKKLPNSDGGSRINFYNAPPELVAAAWMQDACFPRD